MPSACESRGRPGVPTHAGHLHPASKSRSSSVYAASCFANASAYHPRTGTTTTSLFAADASAPLELPGVPGSVVGPTRTPHSRHRSIRLISFPSESSGYPSFVASLGAAGSQSSWFPKHQNTSSNFFFSESSAFFVTAFAVATSPATISALRGGNDGNDSTQRMLVGMSACRSETAYTRHDRGSKAGEDDVSDDGDDSANPVARRGRGRRFPASTIAPATIAR